jgi:TRAP-type uncharacterized transport system fused permease subunit
MFPQIRLWIEYALIAAVVIFAGLAVTVKMESLRQEIKITSLSSRIESAETRLGVVEGVNEAQKEVIQDLAAQRSIDGASIVKLMDTYQELTIADRNLRNQLSNLENNDEARSYLDTPVPNSVGCLWDNSCTATGADEASGSGDLPPGGTPAPLLLAPEKETPPEP